MKRFWLVTLFLTGSMAVLTAPVFAAPKADEEGQDNSEAMEDINAAMGSLSSRLAEMEKSLALKFFGDVRVRVDWRTQAQSDITLLNATNSAILSGGTINDQVRPRYRVRFGAMKQFGDVVGAFRLATSAIAGGAFNNPNSENTTFDQAFTLGNIGVDQAYLSYTPGWIPRELSLKFLAGKMPNPLTISGITWDPDIVPEGFAAEVGIPSTNTKLRATYFDVRNNNGGGTVTPPQGGNLYLTGSNYDEFIANFQLEQLLKIDNDTSATAMVGYEYIPYVGALVGGNFSVPPNGALSTNNSQVGSQGMVWNYGGTIPDVQLVEAMLVINHKIADIPFKWTFHAIDNIDSFNLPASGNIIGTAAAMPASGTYTNFTNQYGFYASVNIGAVKQKNDWAGFLSAGYVEPNAQLPFLTDDDPNYTNTEYMKGIISYGLEDNVTLQISSFAAYHIYYAYLGGATNVALSNKLDGTSQDPEFITFFDAMVSF